jgi:hypothetical protein
MSHNKRKRFGLFIRNQTAVIIAFQRIFGRVAMSGRRGSSGPRRSLHALAIFLAAYFGFGGRYRRCKRNHQRKNQNGKNKFQNFRANLHVFRVLPCRKQCQPSPDCPKNSDAISLSRKGSNSPFFSLPVSGKKPIIQAISAIQ